jgi:RES domain-containing protein
MRNPAAESVLRVYQEPSQRLTLYRICWREACETIWHGVDAEEKGGRWNSVGTCVVYASSSRALAALEQLVHLPSPREFGDFVLGAVTVECEHVRHVDPGSLPAGWNEAEWPEELRRVGDEFVAEGKELALAVPSAVLEDEWNYLLNPRHPGFRGLEFSRAREFRFDPRLK